MNLRDMHGHIEIQLGETIPYASFFLALKRVIKLANIHAEKEEMFIVPTGGLEATESELPQEPYIRIENPAGTPITDLGEFLSLMDGTSETKSYCVGGIGLLDDLSISPPQYFEIFLNEPDPTIYVYSGEPMVLPIDEFGNIALTQIVVRYAPKEGA